MEQHCALTGQVIVMAPCSWEEIIQIALFILHVDIPFKHIQAAAQICGNTPRRCFKAAISGGALEIAKADVIKAITDIQDVAKAVNDVHGDRPVPHRVFEIYPRTDIRAFSLCLVRPVSPWAFDRLMAEVEQRDIDGAYKFYMQIQGSTDAAQVRGRVWERQVHKYLRSIQIPTSFCIYSLDNHANSLNIQFSSTTLHEAFGPNQIFEGRLTSSIRNGSSCYLKPVSKTFASIDSVLYEHDASRFGFQPLIAFQMTDAWSHPLSVKGLATIQKSLRLQVPELKALRPSGSQKWIIVFVVPAPMGESFVKQGFKDPGGPSHWDSKTAQYVLELKREHVFGQSDSC